MTQKKIIIKAICERCDGSGILRASLYFPGYKTKELKDKGVVCFYCKGTGKRVINYRPFKRRRRRTDIKTVVRSSILIGGTEEGWVDTIALDEKSSVSYEDFFKRRKLPK